MQVQRQSGALKEVHEFLEWDGGYVLTGDHPPQKMLETLAVGSPLVSIGRHQTAKFPRRIEIAIANAKLRVARTK